MVFGNDWCPYSHKAYGQLNALKEKFGKDGLKIAVVHVGKTNEKINAYYDSLKLPCPVVFDADEKVSDAYGVPAVPTAFLITKDSRILFSGLYEPQVEQIIQNTLHPQKSPLASAVPTSTTKAAKPAG